MGFKAIPKHTKVKSRFDGATRGSRSGSAYREVGDVNRSLESDVNTLKGRSMGAFLNSPMAKSAISQWVSDEIGGSAKICATSSNSDANDILNELWAKHERFLDFGGNMNLVGILSQCVRERRVNGEVFIRRIGTSVGRYPVPMQVQVISSNSCPVFNRTRANGNEIKQGIEFRKGRKVAAWFYKSSGNIFDLQRVPMKNLIHSFVQEFPSQIRGIPSFSTALLKEADYNSYEENELNRKASQSAVVGMITREDFGEGDAGGFSLDEEQPKPEDVETKFVKFGPNQFLVGADGEGLVMNNSPDVGQNYKDFTNNNQRLVSIAAGLPPQLVTHNYEGINDRTLRQINNAHRRKVRAEREATTNFQVVSKMWRWFVDAAVLSGAKIGNYWENRDDLRKYRFTCEAWAYDHATQDLQAAEKAIQLGVKSQKSFCEERGEDWEQNLEDKAAYIAEAKKTAAKYGISIELLLGTKSDV